MSSTSRTLAVSLLAVALAVTIAVGSGSASAPPVGPLPSGPTATIATQKGQLVAVALPQRGGGRVWRIARPFDASVLEEVGEHGDIAGNVVVVFKTTGVGTTTLSFGLTRGERSKALESRSFEVRVR